MACWGPYVKHLEHFLWISAKKMLYLILIQMIVIISCNDTDFIDLDHDATAELIWKHAVI